MKKYNYENLKEDEHVVPSLGILPIKISEDYNYIPKNIIFNLISDIIIIPIVIILAVIAKIFLGSIFFSFIKLYTIIPTT